MKKITNLIARLVTLLLFLLSFSQTQAFFTKTSDNVVLSEDKKINEAAFISGNLITVDSDIDGDLYCAGRSVTVTGNIKGDVACAAQTIKITGSVDGDVRIAAQSVEITGQITHNLTTLTQSLILGQKSNIKGDIFFGVQAVQLSGLMGRDLAGVGESITITGSLLRNATITGSNLSVLDNGKIGGNLDYYVNNTATSSIEIKNVKGVVTKHEIEIPKKVDVDKKITKVTGMALVAKILLGITSFIVLGFVVIHFDRKNVEKRLLLINNKPFISGLIGLAVLITAPFAFFILLATIVGIPLAFIALFILIIAMITSSLYPSIFLGKVIIEKVFYRQTTSLFLQMITGVILLGLISNIPFIGWIVAFAAFCVGLGAYFTTLFPENN